MKPTRQTGQTQAEYIIVITLVAAALFLLFARYRKPSGLPPGTPQPASHEQQR